MLSRRNIRIKVMQMLYTMSRDKKLTYKEALNRYHNGIESSYTLFVYNLNYLVHIAKYALKDANRRSSKHLPTEEDKLFTPKLFENDILKAITESTEFSVTVDKMQFDHGTCCD